MAATAALAFYLRHDHGLYFGIVAAGTIGLRHAEQWRVGFHRVAVLGATCAAALTPFLLYVHVHAGLDRYVADLLVFAEREHQQNRFERWPA